jgi:pimeloyl-ACP methyl ester carboxylesterase
VVEATLLEGFDAREEALPQGRIRYYAGGAGPLIVLVHGLGGAATNFTELAAALAGRFRVIAVDLPGHGGSDPLVAGAGIAEFAERIAWCAQQEGFRRAAVLGHSFGGAVALRLALTRPEIVSALVLVAPAGISSSSRRARVGLTVLGTLRPSRVAARHRARIATNPALKRLVFRMLASDPDTLSGEAVHGFLAGSERYRDAAVPSAALFAEDPRAELGAVRCPALLLWGARDRFLPLEDGFEYARRLGAPLRVLPDTGHLPTAERSQECARFVCEFLDRVREVEELPGEVETLSEPRRKRLDTELLGRVVAGSDEVDPELA